MYAYSYVYCYVAPRCACRRAVNSVNGIRGRVGEFALYFIIVHEWNITRNVFIIYLLYDYVAAYWSNKLELYFISNTREHSILRPRTQSNHGHNVYGARVCVSS